MALAGGKPVWLMYSLESTWSNAPVEKLSIMIACAEALAISNECNTTFLNLKLTSGFNDNLHRGMAGESSCEFLKSRALFSPRFVVPVTSFACEDLVAGPVPGARRRMRVAGGVSLGVHGDRVEARRARNVLRVRV